MSGALSDSYMGGLFRTASAGNIGRSLKARRRLKRPPVVQPCVKEPKPRKPLASPKRDEVAELLSIGLEFDQIANQIGITRKATKRHFDQICKRLGSQAR